MSKIGRDAFLFLKPKSTAQKPDFAQCGPCRMFVPEEYLQGKLKGDRCIIHGSRVEIDDDDSCGFMCAWPTPDGKPVKKVIEDHAGELLKMIPGSVTPEDSGLVSQRVQCHRCKFEKGNSSVCGLYQQLNKTFPDIFDCDPAIERNTCCNAQKPKSSLRSTIKDAMKG